LKIVIIDYNTGNVGSIKNMLNKIGFDSLITNDHKLIANADKLILPGIGHFDHGMSNLESSGVLPVLHDTVLVGKKPILGICLGAQLMTRYSEEGNKTGLGWFDAYVKKFEKTRMSVSYKIPHTGWNHINHLKSSKLFYGLDNDSRFYFVHSYHFVAEDSSIGLTETSYGYSFLSALEIDNIYAVQFHPEKSNKFGLKLMENFIHL
jgi:imidazole glycerol-phosphate synthase subunit HisH